eukprot:COSAG06_NODE_27562_length_590_cov_55.421589_1_plen_34_part_01
MRQRLVEAVRAELAQVNGCILLGREHARELGYLV